VAPPSIRVSDVLIVEHWATLLVARLRVAVDHAQDHVRAVVMGEALHRRSRRGLGLVLLEAGVNRLEVCGCHGLV